ncbi:uncharacterized protein DSM5745_10435 [Aspergillus mulundensis]|uniref:GPI anchored protein n=1 Tax=Aspergillus mulundensis TaxID=1810919 RepID=A0A3D8QIV8_9EURO|nr:hypothetical protein DSM5745_10435 [Aspergillus mulundensis]RDW61763.1 hypothetical protein DSM5745_10435 [Aspergillus mulundensis]
MTPPTPLLLYLGLSALPLSTAWTFTWRDSTGSASTESGTGPSACIPVNHAKGQLFVADGEGEAGINMLLFSNDQCSGEPAGMATESFAKESSVDLKGFQVVEYEAPGSSTATTTTGSDDLDGTVTLPTVPATTGNGNGTVTATSTDDDGDQTVTLPTVPATTTDGTSEAEPTSTAGGDGTETDSATTTTGSDETSSTEPAPTDSDSAGGEEEPTPTGASSRLVFSPAGLAGIVLGAVAFVL